MNPETIQTLRRRAWNGGALALLAASTLMGQSPYAAHSSCTDDPVIITVNSSYADPGTGVVYTSAILPDSLGPYVNGQNGVQAVIRSCPGESGDATVVIKKRSLTLDLSHNVASGPSTPAWTTSVGTGSSSFAIRNVLYNYNPNSTYSFTTRFNLQAPQNGNYYLRFANPTSDTSAFNQYDVNANGPCDTSPVNVTHVAATGTSKDSWIVWSNSAPAVCSGSYTGAQVSGLLYSNGGWVNVGQFSVPFYMMIQRQ